jgi:hypothetical protein
MTTVPGSATRDGLRETRPALQRLRRERGWLACWPCAVGGAACPGRTPPRSGTGLRPSPLWGSSWCFRMIDKIHMSDLLRLVVLAAVVPALLWPAQLVAVVITEGVRWPVELWSGAVGLSVLVAVAVTAVVGWTPRSRVTAGNRASGTTELLRR